MPDDAVAADYRVLRESAGAVWLGRDAVRVAGPDALVYLDGQLSQDLKALAVGDTAESLLLQPQGKLVAYLRVCRSADDEFILDTDAGFGDAIVERLTRFMLRTKAEITPLANWRCLAVRGPDAHAQADGITVDWPTLPGVDLVGDAVSVPPGVPECALAAYEAVRIEAGVPTMGAELTDNTIPAEVASIVDRGVSFTKGCYTGQELVARVDSRGGNVPRRLLGVRVDEGGQPPVGAELHDDDGMVGALTSVAWSPAAGATVALALVARRVVEPADLYLQWDSDRVAARVHALPS